MSDPAAIQSSSWSPMHSTPVGGAPQNLYVCIQSKTAEGVPGFDAMRPWSPGHSNVAVWSRDLEAGEDRLVGTIGLWPSNRLDNFFNLGSGSDARIDDPRDMPNPFVYPFTHCEWLPEDGLNRLLESAQSAGDFQVSGNDCADFAVDGFNASVGRPVFSDPTSTLLGFDIGSPLNVGAEINRLNSFGEMPYAPMSVMPSAGESIDGAQRFTGASVSTFGISGGWTNRLGDTVGGSIEGPHGSVDATSFDLSLGSACVDFGTNIWGHRVGVEGCVDLGVSGGFHTGEDGRYDIQVPDYGGGGIQFGDNDSWTVEADIRDTSVSVSYGPAESPTAESSGGFFDWF